MKMVPQWKPLVLGSVLCIATAAQALSPNPARGTNGMVATGHRLATDVGVAVLKQGGNAIDAAVAVGYALAVTMPNAGNLGGGGFMVVRMADGREAMIDFREAAPLAASRDMYVNAEGKIIDEAGARTWSGVAVPGTVAGLEYVRQKFGTMPHKPLVMPAVKLARTRDGSSQAAADGKAVVGQLHGRCHQVTPWQRTLAPVDGLQHANG